MCFDLKSKRKSLKATKDITCYKVMFLRGPDSIESIYNGHTLYSFDTLYHAKKRILDSVGRYKNVTSLKIIESSPWETYPFHIHEGFHSYTTRQRAKEAITDTLYSDKVVVKCTIPKGTPYYKNAEQLEYVSTKIIFKEVC